MKPGKDILDSVRNSVIDSVIEKVFDTVVNHCNYYSLTYLPDLSRVDSVREAVYIEVFDIASYDCYFK